METKKIVFVKTPPECTMQITKQLSTENICQSIADFNRIIESAEKEKIVTIQICCGGGGVSVALGFVDLINLAKESGINVQTIGVGHVGSAAVPILMAGTNRFATKHCEVFVHNGKPNFWKGMTRKEKKSAIDANKVLSNEYDDVVVENCRQKMTKEVFKNLCNRNSHIHGDDIIRLGFADAIL